MRHFRQFRTEHWSGPWALHGNRASNNRWIAHEGRFYGASYRNLHRTGSAQNAYGSPFVIVVFNGDTPEEARE